VNYLENIEAFGSGREGILIWDGADSVYAENLEVYNAGRVGISFTVDTFGRLDGAVLYDNSQNTNGGFSSITLGSSGDFELSDIRDEDRGTGNSNNVKACIEHNGSGDLQATSLDLRTGGEAKWAVAVDAGGGLTLHDSYLNAGFEESVQITDTTGWYVTECDLNDRGIETTGSASGGYLIDCRNVGSRTFAAAPVIRDFDPDEFYVPPSLNIPGIQDAIDRHGGNVRIRLGDGTYEGSGLTLDNRVQLIGMGRGNSIIKLADGSDTDLVVSPDVDNRNVAQVKFQDVEFDGNKANNTAGHVVYGAFWNGRFEDCTFRNAPEYNFWLAGSTSGSTDDNFFRGCRFIQSDGKGIRCGTNKSVSPAVGVVRFEECLFGANDNHAIHTRGNSYVIESCKFYGNGETDDTTSIFVDRSNFVNIVDCDIAAQDTSTNLIVVKASTGVDLNTVKIKDNWFRNTFQDGVQVFADGNDVIDLQIIGNSFWSDGQAVDGVDAFGTGNFIDCVLKDNTFSNAFTGNTVSVPSSGWELEGNKGYTTEADGSDTQSGDGSATSFTIAHGLAEAPSYVEVTPKTEDAMADHYITADATNITINYDAAPVSGSSNLEWWWRAEV